MIAIYLVISLAAFLTGLSKGGLGGALGSLVTPMLALVMPAPVAVGLTLPLLLVGDAFAVYTHRNGWDMPLIRALLPGTLVGVLVGTLLISSLSPVTLQHGLGLVALAYTAYKLWQRSSHKMPQVAGTRWQTSGFGGLTGFASTLANAGGPVFTIFLLGKKLSPAVFVSTTALYFALLNVMKLPVYLGAHILGVETIFAVLWAVPLVPFGVWTGVLLDKFIDMPTFELIMLVFLFLSGIALLLK